MKKVLVVEADSAGPSVLDGQLAELGFLPDGICRCSSFPEALHISTTEINLIFISQPALDAAALFCLGEVRKHFPFVPVIVVSDSDLPEDHVHAIELGVQEVLVSGQYTVPELKRAITHSISRNRVLKRMGSADTDYKMHFDNGPIPTWITDSETRRFLLVNNAAVAKYGYSKEEFYAMTLLDIRPKEDVEPLLALQKSRRDGQFDLGYWRHVKKSGEVFYVHVYSHSTEYNSHDARLSFLVDVNEKIQATRKNEELTTLIKEQKDRLDSILLSINDAIWSRRADTMELLYANAAYYKLYGYEQGQMQTDKETILSQVFPDDLPMFLQAMKDIRTIGKVEIIYRHIHKDGSLRILKAQSKLKKGVDGQPDIVNGITNDITNEKELYNAVRNSEQKLRATINNTRDLIWSVNPKLEILFCNEPYRNYIYTNTGFMPEEGTFVLAESDSEEYIESRKKDYRRALGGESFITILEEQNKEDTVYLEISSNPIINHEGKIVGVNCIARDITIQRKQLMRIQLQNDQLREIADIQSHKVRGPVATILGLIPLFDHESAGTPDNADILEKLKTATNDLDTIIREIVRQSNTVEHLLEG